MQGRYQKRHLTLRPVLFTIAVAARSPRTSNGRLEDVFQNDGQDRLTKSVNFRHLRIGIEAWTTLRTRAPHLPILATPHVFNALPVRASLNFGEFVPDAPDTWDGFLVPGETTIYGLTADEEGVEYLQTLKERAGLDSFRTLYSYTSSKTYDELDFIPKPPHYYDVMNTLFSLDTTTAPRHQTLIYATKGPTYNNHWLGPRRWIKITTTEGPTRWEERLKAVGESLQHNRQPERLAHTGRMNNHTANSGATHRSTMKIPRYSMSSKVRETANMFPLPAEGQDLWDFGIDGQNVR
ncbi:hypothetical protein Hypma_004137 [Hypsizygus marmoreus]|uniref:Uncharacterized protein n=1 Tax=Hypsizygus marmoreus TaxID=39966 RepID=A0A369J9M4_HYPMA|nr:hypothetical protein Hypma_004137 [Hypsizygus marmoreus]